jgi:hypothetical protein
MPASGTVLYKSVRERSLGGSGPELTPTSWDPRGELDLRDWTEHGRRFGLIGRSIGWWIGDWLRYGNERFGERYVRASRITGYDVQTLMNMVYVSSRFEPEERCPELSWSHHAEVAALPAEERGRWLRVAAERRLSVRCLRGEIRTAERPTRGTDGADREIQRPTADDEVVCPHCGSRLDQPPLVEAA